MKIRFPLVACALVVVSVAVHLVPGAPEWLQYDRDALARGEWWRGFTAHVVHFDANHLAWDAVVLLAFGYVVERDSRARSILTLLLAGPAITSALWLWQPAFQVYRGLSGLDCALFGLLVGSLMRRRHAVPVIGGAIGLAAIAGKCAMELATASTIFATGAAYAPVPLAHLLGAGAGLIVAFIPAGIRRQSSSIPPREFVT